MGSLFGSKQTTKSSSEAKTNETAQVTPFSGQAETNYNNYVNTAQNNYNNIAKTLGNYDYNLDTSKLDTAYNGMAGMNLTNLKDLTTQSLNPNMNADWVKAQDTIDKNARLGFGSTIDQVNRNIIGTGMDNGSGHQSAMYRASNDFNAQLASDRAKRWTDQYNQNVDDSAQATGRLTEFYNTLGQLGIDYTTLSTKQLENLLKAYSSQNDALSQWGSAVEMGSNPTTTGSSTSSSKGTQTTSSSGLGGIVGTVLGAYLGTKGKGKSNG